jgi:hypothetical protein
MSKTKVILRVKTRGHKVGDEIEVDAETAESMVAMRQADRVRPKPEKG